MSKNIQGKSFLGRKIAAYTLVEDTPIKSQSSTIAKPLENSHSDTGTNDEYDTSYDPDDHGSEFIFEALSLENYQASKRKAQSPLTEPYQQINGKTEKRQKGN